MSVSVNAAKENIDDTNRRRYIYEQMSRIEPPAGLGTDDAQQALRRSLENLRSADGELDAIASRLQMEEPRPPSVTVRDRVGLIVKRQLYRFLWWQTTQIKSLSDILQRRGKAEIQALTALSTQTGELARIQEVVAQCKRQVHETESRLREMESAQLRRQASEIERNVNTAAQLEAGLASIRERNVNTATQLEAGLASIREEMASLVQGALAQQFQEESAKRKELAAQVLALIQGQENEIAERRDLAFHVSNLAQRQEADSAERGQLSARLSELGLFTHQTRTALSLQDRRLSVFLEEARKRSQERTPERSLQKIADQHSKHMYDPVYVAFEDVFRGSREEIKARQSVYLPLLKDRGVGSTQMPILDLGCGRGEWLELLKEHSLQASGLDENELMIESCRNAGLDVIQGDALQYLASLPDASLGGITSFHMVEHLQFDTTLALIDEALRVLKTGGLLILETPNPQNILVGACTFHLDPTHLKPLPSPMLRFFVEARGFCDAHVRELHPYPDTVRFPDDGKGVSNRLNDYLYGPQDYAVIGRKP